MILIMFVFVSSLVLNYVLVLVLVIPHKILNISSSSLHNESTHFNTRKTPGLADFIIEPKGQGWTSPGLR
jgi:hypothetical protein